MLEYVQKFVRTPIGECEKILQSSEMQGVHGDQKEYAQGTGNDHHIPTFPRLSLSDDFPGKEMRIG